MTPLQVVPWHCTENNPRLSHRDGCHCFMCRFVSSASVSECCEIGVWCIVVSQRQHRLPCYCDAQEGVSRSIMSHITAIEEWVIGGLNTSNWRSSFCPDFYVSG